MELGPPDDNKDGTLGSNYVVVVYVDTVGKGSERGS